jgi:hypothetical protein
MRVAGYAWSNTLRCTISPRSSSTCTICAREAGGGGEEWRAERASALHTRNKPQRACARASSDHAPRSCCSTPRQTSPRRSERRAPRRRGWTPPGHRRS